MSKNRYVDTRFWDDEYIAERDPIEKLLFLYFLTNPLTNICGIYEIMLKRVAFDTGIDKDMIIKILERFEKDGKIKYDGGWIAITNFSKHQKMNPNIKKGIIDGYRKSPKALVLWIKERLNKPSEGFAMTLLNSSLNLDSSLDSISSLDEEDEIKETLGKFKKKIKAG